MSETQTRAQSAYRSTGWNTRAVLLVIFWFGQLLTMAILKVVTVSAAIWAVKYILVYDYLEPFLKQFTPTGTLDVGPLANIISLVFMPLHLILMFKWVWSGRAVFWLPEDMKKFVYWDNDRPKQV